MKKLDWIVGAVVFGIVYLALTNTRFCAYTLMIVGVCAALFSFRSKPYAKQHKTTS